MNSIKLKIEDVSTHLLSSRKQWDRSNIPVIFLHGFTGGAIDWEFMFGELPKPYFAIAIDLIGHGKSGSPADIKYYSEDFQIHLLNEVLTKLKISNCVLVGYSMGGRLAISFTLKYPSKINALILESTTAGIEDTDLRDERIKTDTELAERIKKDGIENFVDYWLSLPLFENLSKLDSEKISFIKENKLKNNPIGLANSLNGFGTGVMSSKWNELNSINCKTLLVTGELDIKFSHLNKRMKNIIQNSEHRIIKDCGHNTHLEKPNEFIILTQSFLKSLFK